jgi:pimeloyl-ACP methyl ester carboxylesterase
MKNSNCSPVVLAWATLLSLFTISFAGVASAQSSPPSSAPSDWGPMSISLEEFEYPYSLEYMNFSVYGEEVRIAYMDVAPTGPANGRSVVLHHGGLYYGWYWSEQIKALAQEGYRVVVKDRLGWGKSSKPIIPYSISLWASNTARLMVTRFAFLYPERITHLVTVNQVGLTDRRAGRGFRPLTGEVDANPDMEEVYASLLRWADDNYSVWQPQFIDHMRIRYGQRLSGDWPRLAYVSQLTNHMRAMDTVVNDRQHIQTKTLVLGGVDDYPTFAEEARQAADAFPNGEVFLIPDVGHNPHEEVPDVVSAELIRFLDYGN